MDFLAFSHGLCRINRTLVKEEGGLYLIPFIFS